MKAYSITKLALGFAVSASIIFAADPPPWAYGFEGPPQAGATPNPPAPANTDQTTYSLPGVTAKFSRAQIANRFGPADWFPGDHPQMPEVVARGKQPNVWACGLCHYPNGKGRAENAGVSGLTVEYFIHTMHDFKDGNRKSSDPRKNNTNLMHNTLHSIKKRKKTQTQKTAKKKTGEDPIVEFELMLTFSFFLLF